MENAFQDFQRAFARHLRDPQRVARPDGVPARRAAVYGELVFNNLCGFLDACFPVGRAVLGDTRWRRLNRAFLRDWPLRTPWFREIPREFVAYLGAPGKRPPLPRWFAELAHYEWAELAVDVMDVPESAGVAVADPLAARLAVNPALMNLAFAWPVHRIGPDWRPRRPDPVRLAVYRDAAGDIRFCELSPASARLIELIAAGTSSGRDAVARLAAELGRDGPQDLLDFARPLLAELLGLGILYGSAS
ncbi:DUF2063 domain-containing protein [Azonexus sp.]|uniref:HvfC family RiPP maturation protein n=1 Tax=Azonexus sp. TaxID=1872668 RepID=UPI0035B24583